jgi:hypothetical protein
MGKKTPTADALIAISCFVTTRLVAMGLEDGRDRELGKGRGRRGRGSGRHSK